jgi:hypothetical protein
MTAEERKEGIAPDRISDVAEWGDRKVLGKDFKHMTEKELAAAEKLAAELPDPPHTQDRP